MANKKKEKNVWKITSYQPNNCVTSSSILVEVGGKKILLDLGQIQDSNLTFPQEYNLNMQKIQSIPFKEIDVCCISHLHFDHIGLLPVLAREDIGYNGIILATELTADIGYLIMEDARKINEKEVAKYKDSKNGQKYFPYYGQEHVQAVMDTIRCYSYEQKIKIDDNITITFYEAEHIQGASMVYIEYDDGYKIHTLLYSGDITYGNKIKRPFTKSIVDRKLKCDILLLESTYGKRDKVTYEEDSPLEFLEKVIIEEVVNKNQTLWIPSFACGRATSLYYYLNKIFEQNEEIKKANIPVYFVGEMMQNAHKIIGKNKYNEYYDECWQTEKDIWAKEPFGFIYQKKDVEHFCLNNGIKIVVSSAGMYSKGCSSFLADSYVANKTVSTCACGYQGEGTLGYAIKNGDEYADVNGINKKVRLKFCGTIPSLSGHATRQGLMKFVKSLNQTRLKNVILVHGTTEAKEELKEDLEKELGKNKNIYIIKQFETLKF